MGEDKELISNDRLVRELRQKIIDLTGGFDKKFGKVSRQVKDRTVRHTRMSIYTDDRENDRFYHKLQVFNIDKDNDDELRAMDKNLARLKKSLERRLKDLRSAKEDYEIEDISLEIQNAFQNSPIMQRLLPEELRQRIKNLAFTSEMSKSDYIKLIKAEIEQLNFERDSARATIIANSDPELKKTFDELLRCSELINEEMDYRDAQRDITERYNALCRGYQTIEKIEQELSEPDISEKRRSELLQHKQRTLANLRKFVTSKDLRAFTTAEGKTTLSPKEIMKYLRTEIEDVAFEKNALNGIVDPDVVKRDKFTINKVDCFEIIEKFENLTELQNSRRKRPILNENPDFAEYSKRVELKMLMQELALTYKQKSELDKIRSRLDELNKKTDLTPEELEERSRLSKEFVTIQRKINNISSAMNRIRTLGNELGIPCIIDGSLDLNSIDQLNGVGVSQVEASMRKQKKLALQERKKVCDKYGLDARLNDAEITRGIEEKVRKIETKKGRRIIDLEFDNSNNDVNAPESTPGVTNSNVVPLNFGSRAPEKIPTTSLESEEEYSYQDKKVVQKMRVYDVQAQLDTNDSRYKQRVEFGKVYRYEKGAKDGELLFVEEDLEVYLENPKKKLNEILDGLRDRVRDEFSSEREFENYCDNIENDEFRGLVSKNPIKRMTAKKSLMKKLEQANNGTPSFAYINMAIALNSELLPDGIDETLGRLSQPYGKRENDMIKYVKIKGKTSILGLGSKEKGEIVSSRLSSIHFETARREEKLNSSINLNTRDDGMVRPFEIKTHDIGTLLFISEEPKKTNNRRKNKTKKRDNKAQDGEIE